MKRVVVTAGAAGIGRAMADAFLAEGALVAVCDVDGDAVASFASANPGAIARVADVADEPQMDAFFDHVESVWGEGPDVLCANAGTGGPAGELETLALDEWRACIAVNVDGAFLAARRAVRTMKPRGSGLIVFTSSTAGIMGYPLRTPYASAKWAIVGLTKSLAMELGPHGIRVNALCPGAITGDRMQRVIANESAARGVSADEVRAGIVKGVSMRTWIDAGEIAAMALYLSSHPGRHISGQIIAIDGHTETLNM